MEGRQRQKIMNAAAIIGGVACGSLAGVYSALQSIEMNHAIAVAEQKTVLADKLTNLVEAMHQSFINASNIGSPLFDNNNFGEYYFPGIKGKFTEFAGGNEELAEKMVARATSENLDAYNSFAQSRGFENYDEFMEWIGDTFSGLFNADGTISSTASMQDLDAYYYTFADLSNYLGNEAVQYYSEELLLAGIDPSALEGVKIVPETLIDEAGNSITTWGIDLAPELVQSVGASGLDAGDVAGALGIAALAGVGGYFIVKKAINYIDNRCSTNTPPAANAVEDQVVPKTPANDAVDEANANMDPPLGRPVPFAADRDENIAERR